jgi:hypothetical protein
MSLPECRLVLEQHAQLKAAELLNDTHSRYLASAAKWSPDIIKELNAFNTRLLEVFEKPSSKSATRAQLMQLFGNLEIPKKI